LEYILSTSNENTLTPIILAVDISKSSSASVLDKGGFNIRYMGGGSNVVGDFFSDDLNIGGINVEKLTMSVATNTTDVTSGVLGIGLSTREYSAMLGQTPYKNILDEMVDQGFINSRSYSLWLDGLGTSTFQIPQLFKERVEANGVDRRYKWKHPLRWL
jgi:hypothetical protein